MAKKAQKTTSKARKYVPRKKVPFELEMDREDHVELLDHIKRLKKDRIFRPTMIDGLNLMRDLNKRRSDVLFNLFPWIKDSIETEIRARVNEELAKYLAKEHDKGGNSGGGEGSDMRADIAMIKEFLIHSAAPAGLLMAAKDALMEDQNTGMVKTIDTASMEIALEKSKKIPAYENMISTAKLTNRVAMLPLEVIEYGIKMGKIAASAQPNEQKPAKTPAILPAIAAAELEKPKKKGFSFGAKVQSLG